MVLVRLPWQLVNRLQGLIQTGLSLVKGTRKLKNPKAVSVYDLQMEYAVSLS